MNIKIEIHCTLLTLGSGFQNLVNRLARIGEQFGGIGGRCENVYNQSTTIFLLSYMCLASFPGTWKNRKGAPGIHCSHMRDSPGFSGELGNYCDTSPCCMTVHYWIMGVVTSIGRVWYAFGKVRKPGMVLKDKQLMAIQHV